MKEISTLGIDLAKEVFHVAGLDSKGGVILRKRVYRADLESFVSSLAPTVIGIEACAISHYWGRIFRKHGHEVKIVAAKFVKPYVKSNKNDSIDAEAIAEAITRPTMRTVELKSVEQQDIQALHRVRERLVRARTALINEMRGLLAEYGIILPKGRNKFRKLLIEKLEREHYKLTSLGEELFSKLFEEFCGLENLIDSYEKKLELICETNPVCKRLTKIEGIAALTATALIAAVGDITRFKNGRQFAAWLGLVPRQYTTGGKPRLGRISKRGNNYLRKLLIHGARANLRYLDSRTDRKSVWATSLKERSCSGKMVVAYANKTARAIWAILARDEEYKHYAVAA